MFSCRNLSTLISPISLKVITLPTYSCTQLSQSKQEGDRGLQIMPLQKSLPPWPNPQESIGRQIPSSRVRKHKVWWSRGPASEAFEKTIRPEIEHNLKGLDLGRAELFITLYMIGRKPENANPVVMLCCTDKRARDAAEATIRESGLLVEHKGFRLGVAVLPLEHPAPVRRLPPKNRHSSFSSSGSQPLPSFTANTPFQLPSSSERFQYETEVASDESSLLIIDALENSSGLDGSNPDLLVFASSKVPRLGRRIFFAGHGGRARSQYATAGVVIEFGGRYYQLTVGHLFEPESHELSMELSAMDLNECHFDGESDDDEDEFDHDSEVTDRGSATPDDIRYCEGSSSDGTSEPTLDITDASRDSHQETSAPLLWYKTLSLQELKESVGARVPIGFLPRGSSSRSLKDYALIALPSESVERTGSEVNCISRKLIALVRDVVGIGPEERSIIIFTYSTAIQGVLLPGKVAYRSHQDHQFEKLAQVDLENEVFDGDCGSPVLDMSTGSLYGHLVMGVAGTKVAYIVQAVDIFKDIEIKSGQPVSLATVGHAMTMDLPTSRSLINPIGSKPPIKPEDDQISPRRGKGKVKEHSSSSSRHSASSVFSQNSAVSMSTVTSQPDDIPEPFDAPYAHLPCEFAGYSSCDRTFELDDVSNWVEHIISEHLDGRLPRKAICWYCDDIVFDYKNVGHDCRTNYYQRMWHIREHIVEGAITVNHIRPDHHFNNHLQEAGLISRQTYDSVRRFNEVEQPNWIIPADAMPVDLQARETDQGRQSHFPRRKKIPKASST
jgi:hypothetical protein